MENKIPERPVYEFDQAISIDELKKIWIAHLSNSHKFFTMLGSVGMSQFSVLGQQLLEDIIEWIEEGKPGSQRGNEEAFKEWVKKKWEESHGKD